jgi:hypothetical protein
MVGKWLYREHLRRHSRVGGDSQQRVCRAPGPCECASTAPCWCAGGWDLESGLNQPWPVSHGAARCRQHTAAPSGCAAGRRLLRCCTRKRRRVDRQQTTAGLWSRARRDQQRLEEVTVLRRVWASVTRGRRRRGFAMSGSDGCRRSTRRDSWEGWLAARRGEGVKAGGDRARFCSGSCSPSGWQAATKLGDAAT